jgi:oxalate decarboxylase
MNSISRRNVLTAAAAGGGMLTAATIAAAQSGQPVPQPQRPGHGGTDPGPRNLARDRQNPDILVPPSTDHGTLPICASRSRTRMCAWRPAAGRVR